VTPEAQRDYVRNWVETGRLLEDLRWQELRDLPDAVALQASDHLLSAARLVPLPQRRWEWSGLIDLQDLLHSRHRP
jgi:hypothetical protein